ncbi:hypothetical protein [Actinomyces viscosus]|nr:hypothetical protein [Actinomyces viscosus]
MTYVVAVVILLWVAAVTIPMMPAVAIVMWIQIICLFGGNIYFNRTM